MKFKFFWQENLLVLEINENKVLSLNSSETHDEGHAQIAFQFSQSNGVHLQIHRYESDCDGPMEHHKELWCPEAELESEPFTHNGQIHYMPNWQTLDRGSM